MAPRARPAVSILEDHYRRILGEMQELALNLAPSPPTSVGPEMPAAIEERRALLNAIGTCSRLIEPHWTRDHLRPKKTRAQSKLPYRELLHMSYEVLRPAEEPISTAEIMLELWRRGRLSEELAHDQSLRAALTQSLRLQALKGAVTQSGRPRNSRWIVPKRNVRSQSASGA